MRTDLRDIICGGVEAQSHARLSDVGAVTKTDGTDGSVLVKLSPGEDRDVFDNEFLFILIDGDPVPMRIVECKRRGERSATIRLANVSSVADAENLVGCRVCDMVDDDDDDEADFDEQGVVGYKVVDVRAGELGVVVDYDDRVEANPLLVVDGPYGELLIPAVDDFVVDVDDASQVVRMDVPEGLLDVNSGDNSDVD